MHPISDISSNNCVLSFSNPSYIGDANITVSNYISSDLSAKEIVERSLHIAGSICIYTNENITVETLE